MKHNNIKCSFVISTDRVVDEMNFLLGKMTSVCRKDITCEESNICKLNEPKRNCFPKFENNVIMIIHILIMVVSIVYR